MILEYFDLCMYIENWQQNNQCWNYTWHDKQFNHYYRLGVGVGPGRVSVRPEPPGVSILNFKLEQQYLLTFPKYAQQLCNLGWNLYSETLHNWKLPPSKISGEILSQIISEGFILTPNKLSESFLNKKSLSPFTWLQAKWGDFHIPLKPIQLGKMVDCF